MDISKRVNVTFLWAIRSNLMPRIKNIKSKQISPGAGEIYRKILVLLIQAKCSWGLIIAYFSLWIWVRPSLKVSRRGLVTVWVDDAARLDPDLILFVNPATFQKGEFLLKMKFYEIL